MNAIILFTVIAYALAIALSCMIGLTGGHQSPLIGLGYLSMFLPAVSLLVVNLRTRELPLIQRGRFGWKDLLAAVLLMPGILHVIILPLMMRSEGALRWQDWLTPDAHGLYHAPASWGWGVLTIQALLGHIVLNAVLGLAVVSFLAFFEEIGWRAWLLPRLANRIGPRRAVVVVAIIWALWHVPYQISGIQHIDGVSPATLALVIPFGTTGAGFILGWLWLRTQSIWLVAIAHGALNAWGQYAFKYMDSGAPDTDLALLRAGSLALLVVGAFLLWRGLQPQHARLASQAAQS